MASIGFKRFRTGLVAWMQNPLFSNAICFTLSHLSKHEVMKIPRGISLDPFQYLIRIDHSVQYDFFSVMVLNTC